MSRYDSDRTSGETKLATKLPELFYSLDFDLHARILSKLAETLADSRAKTTTDELTRLKQKCIPLISANTTETLKKQDGGPVIVVVWDEHFATSFNWDNVT